MVHLSTVWHIQQRDALGALRQMLNGAVHCVVTSPPYWRLRRYHAGSQEIGSEATIEEYVEALLAVFREVKRVLRDDGTCWINIGDSYAGGGRGGKGGIKQATSRGSIGLGRLDVQDLGNGNSCLIPFRLALALQVDGWIVRSIVVWAKPAPMPESVGGMAWVHHRAKTGTGNWANCPGCSTCTPNDGLILQHGSWRPTRSHEYILMLVKQMGYYADQEAAKEPSGNSYKWPERLLYQKADGTPKQWQGTELRNPRDVWQIGADRLGTIPAYGGPVPDVEHYARFPLELPIRCIRASTSEHGICPECGSPWARVLVKQSSSMNIRIRDAKLGRLKNDQVDATQAEVDSYDTSERVGSTRTIGWKATCAHVNQQAIGAIVLDPFSGTGTTGLAALNLGRQYWGIELDEGYVALSKARLRATAPLLVRGEEYGRNE